jgi:hypothetical protein
MIEIETVLMPMTFNAGARERFLGVAQVLTDTVPLISRFIAFERLVASYLVREEECVVNEVPLPPVVPRPQRGSRTARGAHLKLVISQSAPALGHGQKGFDGNDALAALLAKCEAEQGGRFRS